MQGGINAHQVVFYLKLLKIVLNAAVGAFGHVWHFGHLLLGNSLGFAVLLYSFSVNKILRFFYEFMQDLHIQHFY